MSDRSKNRTILGVERRSLAYSEGLRAYMLSIYNYMALGLGLTGGVALLVVSSPTLLHAIQPFMLLFVIAPVALVLFLSFKINTMQFSTAQAVFWLYAALNGVAFSVIFLQFTYESIARVFFITGGMFAAMSLYGYTTKKEYLKREPPRHKHSLNRDDRQGTKLRESAPEYNKEFYFLSFQSLKQQAA